MLGKYSSDDKSKIFGRPLSGFFRLGGRGSHQVWKHRKDSGGGAINEMLVHMLDLANWYFGPLQDIQVISRQLMLPQREIHDQTIVADAEDYVIVRCKGISGVELYCQADLITPSFSQYIEIQSENGLFRASIRDEEPAFVYLKEARGDYASGKTDLKYAQQNLTDLQMFAFIGAVKNTRPQDRNTLYDSIQLLKLIEEINKDKG